MKGDPGRSNRPSIPAEIERKVFVESGHRCAVCGTPTPLERAHIIPWRKSKEHKAEDLICLCANCHELADRDKWGAKTLREYKQRPWVMRQYKNMGSRPEPTTRLEVTINMELGHFDERNQRWLQYGLAAFLDIPPNDVRIASIEKSSVKITIELPMQSAERLLRAYKRNDSELVKYLAPLVLLNLRKKLGEEQRRRLHYEYDVFLSYVPDSFFEAWVHERFLPLLNWYLADTLGRDPAVFSDGSKIRWGDTWTLRRMMALARSRCLVAIWSPSYFRSEQCMRELAVMLHRERQLGYRTAENPGGLILPVIVFDGEHFPYFAKELQAFDCRDFAGVGRGFLETARGVEFSIKLKDWVKEVAKAVNQAPPWRKGWLDDPFINVTTDFWKPPRRG